MQKELWNTRLLVKMSGMLCVIECDPSRIKKDSCPVCRGGSYSEHDGWIECCECRDFAILKTDYDRIAKEWGLCT